MAQAEHLNLGDSVTFLGHLDPTALRDALCSAQVYVSVPSSDSFSLSTLEAMATGAFPVVSDLVSQNGWIQHGDNGLRVAAGDAGALAEALHAALMDSDLRQRAAERNRAIAEAHGDHARNMLAMEAHYYRLAGKPAAREASI
jgi:glycosyltransferase involved in cell wall biosynthesis